MKKIKWTFECDLLTKHAFGNIEKTVRQLLICWDELMALWPHAASKWNSQCCKTYAILTCQDHLLLNQTYKSVV